VDERRPAPFDVEQLAVPAYRQGKPPEYAARLSCLDILVKQGATVGMDKGVQVQASEFLVRATVHSACREIGLDHPSGLCITEDDPVAERFQDVRIVLFCVHGD
jgi:hypothetical protein